MKTKKLKPKQWTERQVRQLPEPGYYLDFWPSLNAVSAYCIMNGYCKYIHWSWGTEWFTLLWSCAPTRKEVAKESPDHHFEFFPTHEELVKAHPELTKCHVKAPNDFTDD